MPLYRYTARDRAGQLTSGELEAETNQRAVARLREMGLWVTALNPIGGGAARERRPQRSFAEEFVYPIKSFVSEKDKALFYRQLHAMVAAGMPLYQALTSLGEQTTNGRVRMVVQQMAQQVLNGGRISDIMARYPWLFTRLEVRMVEAGELGGLMEEILRRLADYLEREYNLRLQIKQRTLYPKILLVALIFIPSVVTWFLHGFTAYITDIAATWAWPFVTLIALVIVFRFMLKSAAFRDLYDQVKLSVPVIGPLVRKLAIARFARSMAALYHAGVAVPTAMVASGEASGNAMLERTMTRTARSVEGGASLTQSLVLTRFFPSMFTGMVSTGEQTGNLDETLDKAAEYYENEANHATIQLVVILGVLLLLSMAVFIGMKVIGFWTGFYGGVTAPEP
jgi:type II secretory pathway component PulF